MQALPEGFESEVDPRGGEEDADAWENNYDVDQGEDGVPGPAGRGPGSLPSSRSGLARQDQGAAGARGRAAACLWMRLV